MEQIAVLSNQGKNTCFTVGSMRIRFRTSERLIRYEKVKFWDGSYLVVDANYRQLGIVEEYIDLIPILEDLLMEPESFLSSVKEVKIHDDSRTAD